MNYKCYKKYNFLDFCQNIPVLIYPYYMPIGARSKWNFYGRNESLFAVCWRNYQSLAIFHWLCSSKISYFDWWRYLWFFESATNFVLCRKDFFEVFEISRKLQNGDIRVWWRCVKIFIIKHKKLNWYQKACHNIIYSTIKENISLQNQRFFQKRKGW